MKYGAKRTGTADSMERKAKSSRSAYMKALEDAQKKNAPKRNTGTADSMERKKKAEAQKKAEAKKKVMQKYKSASRSK